MLTKSRLAKGNYLDMGVSNHRGQTKIHWFPNFNSTCFKHFGWVPNVEMIYPCWVLPNTEKKHWIPWNLITDPLLNNKLYDHFPTIKPGFSKRLKASPQDIPPYTIRIGPKALVIAITETPTALPLPFIARCRLRTGKTNLKASAARRPTGRRNSSSKPQCFRFQNC